jgi:hypothetical protein
MRLDRFIYVDATGIASLYAQLRGEDVVETLMSTEHSRASGLRLAINAFIGASGESTKSSKHGKAIKTSLKPENMLREITASLRAQGSLHRNVGDAINSSDTTKQPAWIEARHAFFVPLQQLDTMNDVRAFMFLSGFPPYDNSAPAITMSASTYHFPGARDGLLGISSHDVLFFRSLGGAPYTYSVFGSLFQTGNGYQIKPYAIHL